MARAGWEPWRPGQGADLPGLPRVVGHRGAAMHAPENTLASIRKARELGAWWVEIDAKLSRDGVVILMHDDLLDRTTNGHGSVQDADHKALATLDAGRWFSAAFEGERIPTLRETLALLARLGMGVNVEIKPCPGRETETAEATALELLELWPAGGPPLLVSSFATESLAAVQRVAPDIARGLLVDLIPQNWAELMMELGCTSLHPWHRPVELDDLRALREREVPVLFYTVNDGARARDLLLAGARGIITDAPDRILPFVPAQ